MSFSGVIALQNLRQIADRFIFFISRRHPENLDFVRRDMWKINNRNSIPIIYQGNKYEANFSLESPKAKKVFNLIV
jgi:hypothetical protein